MQFDLSSETSKSVLNSKNYSEFKKSLLASNCTKCALANGRHHIVIDRGNPDAKVMMIGEAPGENEDLQGKAFVGRAGKLLDQLMQEAGIDTNQDTLIANVVKCRPPENRAPKTEEVAQCFPFLQKQIELIEPKIIVLLGRTALKHLIPEAADSAMASQVGNAFEHPNYPGIRIIILYHPAYILRDPRKKPVMAAHIQNLKRLIKKLSC